MIASIVAMLAIGGTPTHLNQRLAAAMLTLQPKLTEQKSVEYAHFIMVEAQNFGVDPLIAIAVAMKESSLRHSAIGKIGEIGLFQLNPASFPLIDVAVLHDIASNIRLGIQHLAKVHNDCGKPDDVREWVGRYSGAPCRVRKAAPVMRYLRAIERFREKVMTSTARVNP